MQETPESGGADAGTQATAGQRTIGEHPFIQFLQRPRILLIMLAAWEVLGALTEFISSSGLFLKVKEGALSGALAGRALGWEQIPLAVLYLYCSRDPVRNRRVFWLALIEQAVAVFANIYHLGASDLGFGSIIIPVIGATVLGGLVFLHLFQPRDEMEAAR